MKGTLQVQGGRKLSEFLTNYPEVSQIDAVFFDINCIPRGKRLPRDHAFKLFNGGLTLPRSLFVVDILGEISNTLGTGLMDGDPDGIGIPLQSTPLLKPWTRQPCAQLLMSMVDPDGTPVFSNPRYQLQRVVEKFNSLDLTPMCALELEFYLIDPKRCSDNGEPLPPVSPISGQREKYARVYDLDDLEAYGLFFEQLEHIATEWKLPLSARSTEFAPGQFEVNLKHGPDPLLAADHACLLRQAVVQAARQCDLKATFLSKPFANQTGNGMHVHLSLLDGNGMNIFESEDPIGTPALRQVICGMQKMMIESMAIFAPHINAYRRFTQGGFAPFAPDWSGNNRSTALRIPVSSAENRRIEHRVAGADANPYLVLAVVLAATLDGLRDGVEAKSPVVRTDLHRRSTSLPISLPAGINAMKQGLRLCTYLQREYLDLYAAIKQGEYDKFMRQAFSREFAWYL